MKNIFAYKAELESKLAAVNAVIADMGGRPKGTKVVGSKTARKRRKFSAAVRAKMSTARKQYWANKKKAGK